MHSIQLQARRAGIESLNGMGGINIHSNLTEIHELHDHFGGIKRQTIFFFEQLMQLRMAGGIFIIDVGWGGDESCSGTLVYSGGSYSTIHKWRRKGSPTRQ